MIRVHRGLQQRQVQSASLQSLERELPSAHQQQVMQDICLGFEYTVLVCQPCLLPGELVGTPLKLDGAESKVQPRWVSISGHRCCMQKVC